MKLVLHSLILNKYVYAHGVIDLHAQCTIAEINASFGSDMLVALSGFHEGKIKPLLMALNNMPKMNLSGGLVL